MHMNLLHHRPNPVRAGGLLLIAVLMVPAALATTLARMDLDELTKKATVVARARCLATSSRWEDGHLWTLTSFEVTEVWKNTAPRNIVVRLVGGRDGHRTVQVDGVPRFRVGEEAVLFLESSRYGEMTVTSWAQGTFRIRRDPRTREESVTQDTGGLGVWDSATREFRPGGARQMGMGEFRERVLRTARDAGRRRLQETRP